MLHFIVSRQATPATHEPLHFALSISDYQSYCPLRANLAEVCCELHASLVHHHVAILTDVMA